MESQAFEFAIRSNVPPKVAVEVFINNLRFGGYLDEEIKGNVKGLKEIKQRR